MFTPVAITGVRHFTVIMSVTASNGVFAGAGLADIRGQWQRTVGFFKQLNESAPRLVFGAPKGQIVVSKFTGTGTMTGLQTLNLSSWNQPAQVGLTISINGESVSFTGYNSGKNIRPIQLAERAWKIADDIILQLAE